MTMRGLFAIVFTVQMGFGGFVFADEVPCADKIRCSDFLYSFFRDKKGSEVLDKEGAERIAAQLRANPGQGCDALEDHEFLREMLAIWDTKTEAHTTGFDCPECKDTYHQLIMETSADKAKSEAQAIFRSASCAPGVTKKVAKARLVTTQEAPETPAPAPPRANVDEPPYRGRQSSYDRSEPVETTTTTTGGGGSFMNSNLMWGLGGALIGGLIGYQLGKNSMQNQYPYQMPYWQQLGPRPPAFGQVPGPYGGSPFGYRPGLPYMYPAPGGLGGFGGAPNILPYGGQFGQPGYGNMMPVNGYAGGFNGVMPLGTGYPGSYGLGTGFSTPIYNYGNPPMILPAH